TGGVFEGVQDTARLGLGAFEVEFVRGVRMGDEYAARVGEEARKLNISLSAHCPYWINCAAKEKAKLATTERNILETARIAKILGARIIVFHPGFYMGRSPQETGRIIKNTLAGILEKMKQEKISGVVLGLETSGKQAQFGTLAENLEIARELGQAVVVDFAHIHARGNGSLKNKEDYKNIFDEIEKAMGAPALKKLHAHFSEIEFSEKGERWHLELGTKNSPPFRPLAEVIAENGYDGSMICESPLLEQDALRMKKIMEEAIKKSR
ncbi:MAG: TIM barrel protein, partial [Candidatus Micrarchaeota archaeon]